MTPDQKLEIIKSTRRIAVETLSICLKEIISTQKPTSEVDFRDRWLGELQKHDNIFPTGWYDPPPSGIIVLFATDEDTSRVYEPSARVESAWPHSDRFLDREKGIALVYASPVDRATGMIGDFSTTLYFGKNSAVHDHLKKCMALDEEIFDRVKVGMKLSEVAKITQELIEKNNFKNIIVAVNDPTGTNMGHTIPFSDEDMNEEELRIFQSGNWREISTMISRKRKYVNLQEDMIIRPGMAFTIEPRPVSIENPKLPMTSFHTICLIKENGEKELLTQFEEPLQA